MYLYIIKTGNKILLIAAHRTIATLLFLMSNNIEVSSKQLRNITIVDKNNLPECRVHHYRRNHLPEINARLGVVGYPDNRQVVMMTVQIKEIG